MCSFFNKFRNRLNCSFVQSFFNLDGTGGGAHTPSPVAVFSFQKWEWPLPSSSNSPQSQILVPFPSPSASHYLPPLLYHSEGDSFEMCTGLSITRDTPMRMFGQQFSYLPPPDYLDSKERPTSFSLIPLCSEIEFWNVET